MIHVEKLKNEIGGAGEKQLLAVLEKSTAADKTRKWFEPGACFAAGTLVHTKEGLVPIEQIKVGDWVLSSRLLKYLQIPHGEEFSVS